MDMGKVKNHAKWMMSCALFVGVVLLVSGIFIERLNWFPMLNSKLLIALSILSFGAATVHLAKLLRMKYSPQTIQDALIKELDERIVAHKNEVDAKSLKIIQGVLFISYMCYSALVPNHIFESAGWWIICGTLMLSFIVQVILSKTLKNKVD